MRKTLPILLFLTMIMSGCGGQSLSEMLNGTATPLPTATSTQTLVPTSTNTPQPSPTIAATPTEISVPDGFIKQEVPEKGLFIFMPETWFYHYEEQGTTSGFFVTQENIEEYGRFSTGLSVNIFTEVSAPTAFVNSFIDSVLVAETTKEVLDQNNQYLGTNNDILFRACVVNAEIEVDPRDPNPSKNKTIIYMAIADPDRESVYLLFFESPTSEWNEAWLNYGMYITQSIIESIDNTLLSITSN